MLDLLLSAFANSPLALSQEQAKLLDCFFGLLMEANKTMNLTAIQSEQEAVTLHFLDSAAPLFFDFLPAQRHCCDMGTGAGFPGIVLAILKPDCSFVLMDSLQKRISFLNKVIEALTLKNVYAVHSRAEDAGQKPIHREKYDVVFARAVAPLPVLLEYCLPLVRRGGHMIAYKGPGALEETEASRHAIELLGGGHAQIVDSGIPNRSHHLIRIAKDSPTPKAYPRKAGTPAKQPL